MSWIAVPFCVQSPINLPVKNTLPPLPCFLCAGGTDPTPAGLNAKPPPALAWPSLFNFETWYSNGTPLLRSPGNVWYSPLFSIFNSKIAPSSSTSVTLNTATSS